MLHPGREEDYVQFLEIRKTPIVKLEKPTVFTSDEDAVAATKKIRDLVLTDRALFDKAQKGFVSWARSYGAHQATSIFRAADLDWADLGNAWGLLRLPRMPELKGFTGDKMCGLEIDWDNYAYKEKTREQARKVALEEEKAGKKKDKSEEVKRKRKNNEAWSAKHEMEDERVERREKRRKRREAEATSKMSEDEKIKQMELNEMLVEIRRQNREKAVAEAAAAKKDKEDEFTGFDD
jgi:ATP-dependent RNA helicase DDX55/SPB4